MPQAKQAPPAETSSADTSPADKPSIDPVADKPVVDPAPVQNPVSAQGSQEKVVETTARGLRRFRLEKPDGEVFETEAATVEDAIRELNSGNRGKVFPFKSLKITEL